MQVNKRLRTSNNTELQQLLHADGYQSLFDHSSEAILAIDLEGRILHMNGACQTIFPNTRECDLNISIDHIVEFNDESSFFSTLRSTETVRFTGTNSSSHRNLEINSIPIIKKNQVLGRFVQVKDRTDELEELEQLKAQKAFWESYLDHSADAIGLFDMDGNIVKLNRATEDIFLYTREELLGNGVITIPDESYRKEVDFLQRKVKSGKTVVAYETVRKRKDGKLINVEITYSPIYDHNGKMIAMTNILRDITERKKATMKLRESEAKYRLIAENTADMIRVLDLEGKVYFASPSHKLVSGRQEKHYEGKDGFHFVHPEDLHSIKTQYQKMLEAREPIHFEYREIHKDGEWIELEAQCTPVINQGEINSVVMVIRDLTERKQTEELLRNSDKLAVIGQMAASIAHEIRNPLTSLKGFLQFFHSNSKDDEKDYYELMLSELERINLIVSEFLMLAKPQTANYKETPIDTLFSHLLSLIDSQAIMENIEITTDFEGGLPAVLGDENQLKQAFLNFIKNALEATASGGTVDLTLKKEGTHICIHIKDNGCGIAEENLKNLGKPFFSTKETGTGLGLMISQKIIANHKGTIDITSEDRKGTTVTIKLPIVSKGARNK
ncbi:PAS domain S-box protein [Pseudalkalibacillus sp. R45]|uniref:PAS domain S-box protein n=1 Tax=Pseudalkalibacillus sp. R45 TaxID=3457433 RepID=UPI003FCD1861